MYEGKGEMPTHLNGVNIANVAIVEKLDIEIEFGWHSYSYLLVPRKPLPIPCLAIVHQGHQGELSDGIGETINKLLAKGMYVLAMQMPLVGWNRTDLKFKFPDGTSFTAPNTGWSNGHIKAWPALAPQMAANHKGSPLRFFFEPVVTGINYFLSKYPACHDIAMMGLSGGAWTTTVAPAIDTRITLSIPVAGSQPAYVGVAYGHDYDYDMCIDPEQQEKGMRKIADYLDMYVMAATGPGRRQVYVNNQFDPCCAFGVHPTQWGPVVAKTVATIDKECAATQPVQAKTASAPKFQTYTDTTHKDHKISSNVQQNVILPALGLSE